MSLSVLSATVLMVVGGVKMGGWDLAWLALPHLHFIHLLARRMLPGPTIPARVVTTLRIAALVYRTVHEV